MHIRTEQPQDAWEVEALYDTCFGPTRTALSSYRLRVVPPVKDLCLILRTSDDILAGAIRYWPAKVAAHDILLLGPVAVHPTFQGEGLGALLIQDSLERAWLIGAERVLLVGDAPYYARFGFVSLRNVTMPPPTNPDRVLGIGAWAGVEGHVRPVVPRDGDPHL